MKIIACIVEQIQDEIEGSEEYIECAIKYKDENKNLSDMYYNLSVQELSHIDMLHAHATRIIEEYKKTGEQVPNEIMIIYNWEHDKVIEKVKEIRLLQNMYVGK